MVVIKVHKPEQLRSKGFVLFDEMDSVEPITNPLPPREVKFHAAVIRVSSTNPKGKGGKSVIRVYKDGVKIAEEYIAKRSPLVYLNTLKYSKHFASLEGQLIIHGLTLADIGVKRNG